MAELLIDKRIKELKEIIKIRTEYNKKAVIYQNEGVQFDDAIYKLQKPVTDVLAIEGAQTRKAIAGIRDGAATPTPQLPASSMEAATVDIPNINKEAFGKAISIIPQFTYKEIGNESYQCIIILNKELTLFKNPIDNKNYFTMYNTLEKKYQKEVLSDDLLNLMSGNLGVVNNPVEMRNYLNLLQDIGYSSKSSYIKSINEKISMLKRKNYISPEEEEDDDYSPALLFEPTEFYKREKGAAAKSEKAAKGEGVGGATKSASPSSDNPISLFTELYKMLAAKKAGHNNLDKPIRSILIQLTPHIRKEKCKKIIKKYEIGG